MLHELEILEILLFDELLRLIINLALQIFNLLIAYVRREIIAYDRELAPQDLYVVLLIYFLVIIRHLSNHLLYRLQKLSIGLRAQFEQPLDLFDDWSALVCVDLRLRDRYDELDVFGEVEDHFRDEAVYELDHVARGVEQPSNIRVNQILTLGLVKVWKEGL